MKKVTLQIYAKFRVVCGKFMSAKNERISSVLERVFGVFVVVRERLLLCLWEN